VIAAPRLPGLIGLTVLVNLVVTGILLLGWVPAFLLVATAMGTGSAWGLAVVLVLVAGVLATHVGVSLSMAMPAYMLERIGVMEALHRSRALVRGDWWRVFGILVLGGLVLLALSLVVGVPLGIAGGGSSPSALVLPAIGAVVVGTVAVPFGIGVSGLLYIDQRIRRERFDIELARAVSG
jgi:hypothetical protein